MIHEQEANMTQPFQLDTASTPYGGGQFEMETTMQCEQTGLPSYEETSFGSSTSERYLFCKMTALQGWTRGWIN